MTSSPSSDPKPRSGWRQPGLRFKFVTAIVLVLTVTLGGVALLGASYQQRLLHANLDNKARALGQFVALISPAAIYSFDITTLDRFIRQVSGDPDVRFALIRNEAAQPLTTYYPEQVSREEVDGRIAGTWPRDEVELLYFPVMVEGASIGDVVIAVDLSSLRTLTRETLIRQAVVYLGIILFLVVVIFRVFSVNVLRPVAGLMGGASRVSRGELGSPVPVMSSDELGSLARCFNDMMGQISDERDELLATNAELAAEMRRRQEAARQLQTLSQAIEQSPASVVLVGMDGRIEYVNPQFKRMSGYSAQEAVGKPIVFLCRVGKGNDGLVGLEKAIAEKRGWAGEQRNLRKDGSQYWESMRVSPIRQTDGRISHHLVVQEDITQRKESERNLQLAASVFTHAREGIVITESDGTIIEINDAFTRITGYPREEVLGQTPKLLKSGRHGKDFYAVMWNELKGKGHWYGEIWNRRKNGEIYPEILTVSAVRDGDGSVLHYVALFTDITAQKAHQEQLEHIAHFDALTNLPNRVLLADRLHQSMVHAKRYQHLLAVAYLDLDGFKAVNDTHGHEMGDQLLIRIAEHAKRSLREGDTIARIGGDEFVAVITDLSSADDCVPLLKRLLAAASRSILVEGRMLRVSASVGVTFYPQDDDVDADQLLRQADQAMYQAKLAGKNRYHIFDMERDRSVRGQYESLERIRHALEGEEFRLHYQPKVNMRTGEVVGLEALIRWQHPQRGLLPPGVFLPVVEDNRLAVDVGNWVLRTALSQVEAWRKQGCDLPVSVNVAARQLQAPSFVDDLRRMLGEHPGFPPNFLQLEVLETSVLDDISQVSQVMHACHDLGVVFALDDFGTGYSSLTYLRRLPAEQLKIDCSFVRDMLDDPDDLAILEGVLGLAAAFRREAIAEGVETVEHGVMLLQLGCELAQGYAIARPMPADDVPEWVQSWRPDPAWQTQTVMAREELPRLFAGVEHRAWVRAVGEVLRGEHLSVPPLDHRQCRFGQWLNGMGRERYAGREDYEQACALHEQVHALGNELVDLRVQGFGQQALERLPELHELREDLLAALGRL